MMLHIVYRFLIPLKSHMTGIRAVAGGGENRKPEVVFEVRGRGRERDLYVLSCTLNVRFIMGIKQCTSYGTRFPFPTLQHGDTLRTALYMAQMVPFKPKCEGFCQGHSVASK